MPVAAGILFFSWLKLAKWIERETVKNDKLPAKAPARKGVKDALKKEIRNLRNYTKFCTNRLVIQCVR